jgi:hypothetical protein
MAASHVHAVGESDIILEARPLLAVEIDGSFVVLDVDPENEYLASDVKAGGKQLHELIKFSPQSTPIDAGLCEFKGFSARENLPGVGSRVVHRGACFKIAC